jgi:hypothetical protein
VTRSRSFRETRAYRLSRLAAPTQYPLSRSSERHHPHPPTDDALIRVAQSTTQRLRAEDTGPFSLATVTPGNVASASFTRPLYHALPCITRSRVFAFARRPDTGLGAGRFFFRVQAACLFWCGESEVSRSRQGSSKFSTPFRARYENAALRGDATQRSGRRVPSTRVRRSAARPRSRVRVIVISQ